MLNRASKRACHAGPLLNFVLLSWLYALYCFDYKWSLHGVALQQRIAYFERHWCFFLGGPGSLVIHPWISAGNA